MASTTNGESDARGPASRKRFVTITVLTLVVTVAIVITVFVDSRSRAPGRADTIGIRDRGFAEALVGLLTTSNNVRLPARVHVSVSNVDGHWAYGSWTATFHDNGTYTKTFYVAEEYVGGTYRHFGKGYLTTYCPRQMPTAVCVGGFQSRTVVVK
jgi:hypothetical protein